MNYECQAELILKEAYGQDACFREGQLETIVATLTHMRTLVVQKTGWGKSLVYFVATKIIRQAGGGTAVIISPLLELMNNQVEAAVLFNLKCRMLNSSISNTLERSQIIAELLAGNIDIFFTTPETLFLPEVQSIIADVNIGLFVIDEAHCLSDWGHDFRREYGRLYKIISLMPASTPVLCTTATANDRVIDDLTVHLGKDIYISKGDLMRESLYLQVVHSHNKSERYAWILDHIMSLPGTGIIYCLTKRECDYLCIFLKKNGIAVEAYYSDSEREKNGLNRDAIVKFKSNQIKAIIATIKLGMGYDKPDIGFVIHYQRPQNIVAYYQQIGRAGRNIEKAFAILMTGSEDDDILNYFIDNAFPDEMLCKKILVTANGKRINEILASINARKKSVVNAISFLEFEGYLRKEDSLYYRTPKKFVYYHDYYDSITAMRRYEMEQMFELTKTNECLLRYTVRCLNNTRLEDCGRCSNCTGNSLIPQSFSNESLQKAQEFINQLVIEITPRIKWAKTDVTKMTNIKYPLQIGFCLCKYGDVGYGEMVKYDKYYADEFRDELLVKAVKVIQGKIVISEIRALTYVPSLRNDKVKKFARKLAATLKLEFIEVLQKSEAPQQKTMENSSFQCQNALHSFSISSGLQISGGIILVDDIVDSRWTLAVCGDLLGSLGLNPVVPFCLADSSEGVFDEQKLSKYCNCALYGEK